MVVAPTLYDLESSRRRKAVFIVFFPVLILAYICYEGATRVANIMCKGNTTVKVTILILLGILMFPLFLIAVLLLPVSFAIAVVVWLFDYLQDRKDVHQYNII